jgi:peptidoglycan DL-endopeptidase CwlO
VRIPRGTFAVLCTVAVAAMLAGDLSAASPKERLREKRAEARSVLAQVNSLDQRFEQSVEAWNGARYELVITRRKLADDRVRLRAAQRDRRVAVSRLAARARAMYESSDQPTTLGILLGSTSMSDFLDRLNEANTVAAADRQLARQTTAARNRLARVAREAAAVAARRAVALTQRTRERKRIGSMLAERKRLLASVQSDVVKLQADERARQARLAAQARARLAQQLAAARQAREDAAARAAERARVRAQQAKAVTTTEPATTTAAQPTTTTVSEPPPATTTTETQPASPTSPAPGSGGHPDAAQIALHYLGVPYLWGGASPAGFDCSGLVMYVYAQLGISLPHYAAAQYQLGTPVARSQLQPGDLVFFDGLAHVGIYVGGGQVVHAPRTGDVVKISPISDWGNGYVGARRI